HRGTRDRLVFANDIACVAVLSNRKMAHAVRKIEQGFVKLPKPAGGARRDQGRVEATVQNLPLPVRSGNMFMTAPKPVVRDDDLLFPKHVAMRDGLPYGDLADPTARSRELLHVVGSNNGDAKATLLDLFDEMQRRQPIECLAQRAAADLITLAQGLDPQLLSGPQNRPLKNVGSQPLEHRRRQRRRHLAVCLT